MVGLAGFGEMLPNPENRVTLHATKKDEWGLPVLNIHCEHGENDKELGRRMLEDAKAMVTAAGGRIIRETGRSRDVITHLRAFGRADPGEMTAVAVLEVVDPRADLLVDELLDGPADHLLLVCPLEHG